jgi:hypothetical protein
MRMHDIHVIMGLPVLWSFTKSIPFKQFFISASLLVRAERGNFGGILGGVKADPDLMETAAARG